MLARIESSRHAGRNVEEALKILELFSERARQVRKNTFRLLPTREERLNDETMPYIISEEQNATKVRSIGSRVQSRRLA